ncbi:hypothetical protein [Kitasatospora sp. NPDC058190]|uniref:hypothetical protein n=1 Tax=Kitasatospora sp. NPDC058190 TaxID=3346371 RepID=UPI0036DA83A1
MLDGQDVADHVRSFELRHTAGQFPELLLMRPTANPEREGTACVVVTEALDSGPAAAAFL